MKQWILLVSMFCGAEVVLGQTAGTCATGKAEAYLDVGNVRARLMNTGGLFWNSAPNVYEVPKGSGINSMFHTSLWLGGKVQDSLRMAATQYGPFEYWPGPIKSSEQPLYDCSAYDRLAVIYRDDIERYERSGHVSTNLATWPWQWGAPVIDGDGDPDNYNLAGGDRPELLGDQTVWWVMNDLGNAHGRTLTQPIGMEVRVSAFAFNTVGAVGNATFYRYQFHYKGIAPLDSAYVGFFNDPDLGEFSDDYIGSDTTLGMGYVYNADDLDEEYYGPAPPALGLSLLQGPIVIDDGYDNDRDGDVDEAGERLRVSSVNNQWPGAIFGRPDRGPEYYNILRGLRRDGTPMTEGGFSDRVTPFIFPGDPVTGQFWSEVNYDGNGNEVGASDRRFVVGSGPFRMMPDEVQEIVLAIAWARGDSNLDAVRKLREDMAYIQGITQDLMQPRSAAGKARQGPSFSLGYYHAFPNPFRQTTTIRYSLERSAQTRLAVYDVLGREMAVMVDAKQDAGWHEVQLNAADFAPGVYFYRLQVGEQIATETMVVQR